MKYHNNVKWALVLSGGGAKGLAHVGVLKALHDMGVPKPSMVAGTSMGAIIGGIYTAGMSPPDIYRFAKDSFDLREYMDSFVYKMNGVLGKVFQTGQILGSLASRSGIDSGQHIQKLLEKLTSNKKIEDAEIPFRCNAVDLCTGKEVVFRSGSMASAIRASMGFPGFFDPVVSGDMCLVDGGLKNNLPVYIPRTEGIKFVLAVDVGGISNTSLENLTTSQQVIYRSLELILQNGYRDKSRRFLRANLTIHASDGASPLDFDKSGQFIDLGEKAIYNYQKEVEMFFGRGMPAYISRRKHKVCGILGDEPIYRELEEADE